VTPLLPYGDPRARALWPALACVLAWAAGSGPAVAQQVPGATAVAGESRVEALTPAQAEQARLRALIKAAPQAYEDHFMDAGGPDIPPAEPEPEPEGLRTWAVESRIGFGEADSTGIGRRRATEFGQRFEYRQQTLNYGEWVLQADLRSLHGDTDAAWAGIGALGYARDARSQRFTLRSLGLPLTQDVLADSAVGDIYSELTDGLSRNYRLSLGSSMVRGISTRIYGSDFDLRAGIGERGNLVGGPYPGFEKSQGSLAWLGYTRRLDGSWYVAGQIGQAHDIPAFYYSPFSTDGLGSKNVSSWAAAVGYGSDLRQDGDVRLRLTAIGSHTDSATPSTPTGSAQGLFLEGGARLGRFRHEFGAYAAQPHLHFGDYELPSGTRGAYWRVDHSGSRLGWGAGLDYERSLPDGQLGLPGYVRTGASANFQYLLDRHNSVGGSLNLYQTRYDAGSQARLGDLRSLYGYAFYQTRFFDWPRTRLSLTVRRNEQIVLNGGNATGQELQWEQDWIGGRYETMRPELTTTLGYAQDRSSGTARHYPTAGVQLRYWLSSSLSLSGNLRYTSQSGGLYTSRGLSGTFSAEKDLGGGWRLGVAASLNQARAATTPQVAWSGPQLYRSNDKVAYVYLRWEGSAGRPFPVAGAVGGAGTGSVAGRVFFDANRDGEQQMGEGGAPNVEVLLDGRYRTTTDRDGRFEFPMVGVGRHQLTLTLDSVPLPWGAAADAGVSVQVPLRGQATAEIPVIKVGE